MDQIGPLPPILAIYGLAFFSFGLAVAVRAVACPASSVRLRFFYLSAFGLVHGLFEWLTLVGLVAPQAASQKLILAVSAFSFLCLFGFAFGGGGRRPREMQAALLGVGALWCLVAWLTPNIIGLEVFTRLAFGLPASFATAYALLSDTSLRPKGALRNGKSKTAAICFAVYGLLQLFSSPGEFFPASTLNVERFEIVFGVSCYVVRAALAVAMMVAILTLLGRFERIMWQEREAEATALQSALELSETSLEKAQRIASVGSWEWDITTNGLAWSDQIYRIFGLKPQEFGASYPAFLERVHPGDRAFVEISVRRTVEEGAPYDIKHRIVLPDDTVRVVHEQGELDLDPAGNPVRMTGTVQDITEQQALEDALRNSRAMLSGILTIAEEAIVLADDDMNIILFSHGAQRVFGYKGDEAIGMSIERLMPERFRVGHRQYVRAFAMGSVASLRMDERQDIVALRKDGEEFPAAISLSKRLAENGNLYAIILRDIGPERRAQEELLTAKLAAESANRAKSEFLATMSHELRTPLNAIIGFSEMMNSDCLGSLSEEQVRGFAGDIEEAGKHLLQLVTEILDLSKIESEMDSLQESSVDLPFLLGSVERAMQPRAARKEVTVSLEVADDLPAVRADARKLKQILVNLMDNAIKFSNAGGAASLVARFSTEDGFLFEVSDRGIGIAPEDIPKALSKFGQVDGKLNRDYQGTGLGLPLAVELVRQHGGDLDVKSAVGEGTRVTVRLPAARAVMPDTVCVTQQMAG